MFELLHTSAFAQCTHAAGAVVQGTSLFVKVMGMPAAKKGDSIVVMGCPLIIAGAPQPCLTIDLFPSAFVRIEGVPALSATTAGLCLAAGNLPQGAPLQVKSIQPFVKVL